MKKFHFGRVAVHVVEPMNSMSLEAVTEEEFGTPTPCRVLTIRDATDFPFCLVIPEAAWPEFQRMISRNGGTVVVPASNRRGVRG